MRTRAVDSVQMVSDVDANASLPAFPSAQDELWRYSRIDDLDLDRYQPTSSSPAAGIPESASALLPATRSCTVVTVDGRLVSSDSDTSKVAATANNGTDAPMLATDDYFERLNAQNTPGVVTINIAAGAAVEAPIVVVHIVDDGVIAFPRTIINVGESAQASIVEYLISAADAGAFMVPFTEVQVGAAANINYAAVQVLNTQTNAIAYQASVIDRDATFCSSAVALGGSYARVRTDSRLHGKGSTARLDAVYLGADNQMHDFRTIQDHRAPKTTSDLLFKGVVAHKAHSVYSGLIRVEKGASGTNAFQTNRNLVLSEGARADSVPNLEIEENDVRCSHASAVGPVDEEQQYYLESRGVPTTVAERLIVTGFLEEMLARIPVEAVRDPLRQHVANRLDSVLREVNA